MFQSNSRIEFNNGIKFYEQDILYDDYIYTGNLDLTMHIDYSNPGFGIALINSEGSSLAEKEEILLFKIGNKNAEVIYKNKDSQKTLANFNCAYAKTYTENLYFKLKKNNNIYELYIGEQLVCKYKAACDIESYNIGYYSNKDNILKDISIASSVPYGWTVNMENTSGGYIEFYRDSFELKHCNNQAEIEQIQITLPSGKYYLKYNLIDSDILSYVFLSDDKRINDEEKNILAKDKSFILKERSNINIKFKGTKGRIKNILLTTLKDNEYVRTDPESGNYVSIDGSYLKFFLNYLSEITFKGFISFAPGHDHSFPIDYQIISDGYKNYGLYDLDIALNIEYDYKYKDKTLFISKHNKIIKEIKIYGDILTIFKNINATITDLIIVDNDGKDTNIIVENTIKKYVPGAIKSPIIVLDQYNNPLDLSSSYRRYYKNNIPLYWFTNVEREYFKPNNLIYLTKIPSDKVGTIIAYGIKKDSKFNLDKLLDIEKEGKDTIDACANLYDILFEKDLKYIDRKTGEIRFSNVDDYQYIVIDYLKNNSYCINFRYNLNSYEVDISSPNDEEISVIYDNTEKKINDLEYINEQLYLDTKIIPSVNCYIVLGR